MSDQFDPNQNLDPNHQNPNGGFVPNNNQNIGGFTPSNVQHPPIVNDPRLNPVQPQQAQYQPQPQVQQQYPVQNQAQPQPQFQQPNQNQNFNQPNTQFQPQQPQIQNQQQFPVQNQPQQPILNPSDPNYYANNGAFDMGFGDPNQAQVVQTAGPNVINKLGGQFQALGQNKLVATLKKNWWITLSGAVLLIMLFVAASYFLSGLGTPVSTYNQVVAKASSDARVPSGSVGSWKINIENRENTTLDQVKLFLDFDRTFTFSRSLYQTPDAAQDKYPYGSIYSLGQLKPFGIGGSSAQISIEGTLIGDLDTESILGGHVEYLPAGSSRKLRIELEKAITKIGAPQVTIDVSAPTNIKNGTEGDIYVDFKNSSDKSLSNLRIKLNYPPNSGFKYISSQLQLSKTSDVKTQPDEGDNIWLVSDLPRFTPQQLKIHGQFVGVPGEIKKIDAEIGVKDGQTGDYQVLAKKSISVTVTGEILQVSAALDGKDSYKFFTAGETVTVKISYKNTSTRNLEDMKVLGWLDDPAGVLDMATVAYTGGDRGNYNNGKLEWTQQGAPQLRLVPPNSGGDLSFSVKVKDGSGFLNGKAQNLFTLRPRALASAAATDNVEIVGSEYKALGDLKFAAKTERQITVQPNKNDPNLPAVDFNSLQVGVPASYVVTWTLTGNQTQINNIKVTSKSTLPASVWDQTTVKPITEDGKISYDKVTGQIVWNVGNIPSYTGTVSPSKTVSFVLTFTPSQPQINSGVNIHEEINITGTDDFTGQLYQLKGGAAQVK